MAASDVVLVRAPVRAGDIVDGKYRIDGILGAGGMGVVVSATQIALDEPVALKFMTAAGKGEGTARQRFFREAKAARKLTSAHVARVFDVGQLETGEPYIVMELLIGEDLGSRLRRDGALALGEAAGYMRQVCDAIREAHALGVVHRDLKPQNLFLARRPGSNPIVKVLDFGIAKSLEPEGGPEGLTTSQNVVGSPVYMSPEQLRASKHVDPRTDIWSMGVILFELLAGKVPFSGESVVDLGVHIATAPTPSLTQIRPDVSQEFAAVVERCLAKDPAKRFPTIDALDQALAAFTEASTLPFAATMHESSSIPAGSIPPPPAPEQTRTGAEFGGTKSMAPSRQGRAAFRLGWAAVPFAVLLGFAALHRSPATPTAAAASAPPAAIVPSHPAPVLPAIAIEPPPVPPAPPVSAAPREKPRAAPRVATQLRPLSTVPSATPPAPTPATHAATEVRTPAAPAQPPQTTTNDAPIIR